MNKIPVDVEVEVRRDGEQIPKAVIWSDGRRFTISRVVYHGMSSSNEYEAMIKDFMKRKHYTNAHCVDIEAFVTEYLGIPIVYETFAEPDPGRIGFLSDGIRPLWVVRGNGKKNV